jgi:hypothetical protein
MSAGRIISFMESQSLVGPMSPSFGLSYLTEHEFVFMVQTTPTHFVVGTSTMWFSTNMQIWILAFGAQFRQGTVTFIGTPKGRNSFFEMWQRAKADPAWFSFLWRASETGILPQSELDLARGDITQEQYDQEFECFL